MLLFTAEQTNYSNTLRSSWLALLGKSLLAFLIFIALGFFSGCSISDRTTYEDGEGRIPEKVFSDIRRGKTEKSWLVSQLGEPDILQSGPDSKEIYTYRLMRAQEKHADLLIFLRYDGVSRDVEYFHVFFENNIVRRHWRDSVSEVQTRRYFGKITPEPVETVAQEQTAFDVEPEHKSELTPPSSSSMLAPSPSQPEEVPNGWTAEAKRELAL
ncbi:hypothetical protein SAMN02745866_02380 [Alteromonadaceae bacterium Bs31]|nr:hypothetical protein SAMN02745866_02380 [Alteromonadaceae bacterium Bs31]